ncbi:hypothetical protein KO02_10105 [Sphingobacterium sp. ML3W]|uniref:hypothetical protein n=1 Tax=Sphingobacterium sp. ML3W TaxID=1538644 RepID=UPI0004F87FB9|nr:hypothetical protein [Sphingobacterium sp. ML3W]AIM37007.1 hypothetical protein KO02_10105 [Sphingobacterium sp. ML3W]
MNFNNQTAIRQKQILYFTILFVFPIFFNLMGYDFKWNEIKILSAPFLLLSMAMLFIMLVAVVWISYVRHYFGDSLKEHGNFEKQWRIRVAYYSAALLPFLVFFTVLLLIWIWRYDRFWDIWKMYAIWRYPQLIVVLGIFSYVLIKNSTWALAILKGPSTVDRAVAEDKQAHAEEKVLPQVSLQLNELYDHILNVLGATIGPIYRDMIYVRFFDIVGILTRKSGYQLILSDGSMIDCPNILKKIIDLHLGHWMVKISDNYTINMLLVDWPDYSKGLQLIMKEPTLDGLREKLSEAEIEKMFKIGTGIRTREIKNFLEKKEQLTLQGWDTWVPLR